MTAAALAAALGIAACSASGGDDTTIPSLSLPTLATAEVPPVPDLDLAAVVRGEELYRQHCAVCHGPDLAGDPGWRTPNEDGSYPPPPQDATGHTWHHPDRLLVQIVTGEADFPESRMPDFAGVLTEQEVRDILDYLKSSWGPEERAFQWRVTWQDEQGG
jgi:mono/diheme cytochrome c family protein